MGHHHRQAATDRGAAAGVRHGGRDFLALKLRRAFERYRYCNAVTDKDLWVLGG